MDICDGTVRENGERQHYSALKTVIIEFGKIDVVANPFWEIVFTVAEKNRFDLYLFIGESLFLGRGSKAGCGCKYANACQK